jgi:hypothetical protein
VTFLGSGLPVEVANSELIARFIVSSSWIAKTIGRVKHQAYLPAADGDTSVFRTQFGEGQVLWDAGSQVAEGRTVHGAGLTRVEIVKRHGLDVIAAEPPPRHANVRGWPKDPDPELQKARRKLIAEAIAEDATFTPPNAAVSERPRTDRRANPPE